MVISLRLILILVALGAAPACGAGQKVDTKKSNNRLDLAKDFLSRQELVSARQEANKALALNPDNAEAHTILGLVSMVQALNNHRLLEMDACLTGVDAEGIRIEKDEFLQQADVSFGKAVSLDGSYSEALANQANAAALLEDYERSIALNEEALKNPHRLINLSLTRANLAWAKFHAGDDVGAAKDLRQALQFNPEMCVANYRLGRVYFKREEWNKAVEQFQTVVRSESCGVQEAHLYLIRSMKKLSMTEESATYSEKDAIENCTVLAPQSCIAAQCQAGL